MKRDYTQPITAGTTGIRAADVSDVRAGVQ
jgi:hypothetical protein